jgi:hypothetical protein
LPPRKYTRGNSYGWSMTLIVDSMIVPSSFHGRADIDLSRP